MSEDSIIFYELNMTFAKDVWKTHFSTLEVLIKYCLSQTDYRIYDDNYFSDFFSPYFSYDCYHALQNGSISKHANKQESFLPKKEYVNFKIDLGLSKEDPLYKYNNTILDVKQVYHNFVQNPFDIKFEKGLPYTLSNVLYECIEKM